MLYGLTSHEADYPAGERSPCLFPGCKLLRNKDERKGIHYEELVEIESGSGGVQLRTSGLRIQRLAMTSITALASLMI